MYDRCNKKKRAKEKITNVLVIKELIIENRKIYNNITKDNHHPNRIKKNVIKIFNECIHVNRLFEELSKNIGRRIWKKLTTLKINNIVWTRCSPMPK